VEQDEAAARIEAVDVVDVGVRRGPKAGLAGEVAQRRLLHDRKDQ
jgi:hypothetical protein